LEDIRGDIIQKISELCSCQLQSVHVTDDKFSCRGAVGRYEDTVVYRAKITSVGLDITADQLVEFIHIWAQSGAIIEADRVSLDVDPDCTTQLESFTANDCVSNSQTSPAGHGGQQSSTGLFVAISLTAVIILVLIGVIVVLVYCKCRPMKRYVL